MRLHRGCQEAEPRRTCSLRYQRGCTEVNPQEGIAAPRFLISAWREVQWLTAFGEVRSLLGDYYICVHFQVLAGGPAELVVILDEDQIVAAGFAPVEKLAAAAGLLRQPQRGEVADVAKAWSDYLAGDLAALARPRVQQSGSPVQELVWQELREIPSGEVWAYSEVAARIGHPRAARAVGAACGANRIAPFVPCHRVVAADGSLGGYGYGVQVKQWLLAHEGAVMAS
ncbi:MAG: methylated-DNA--[protein]-cysteine S-methyltransferase [Actinomycetia bacterium]|nr:methylated-DNA--[protein]-cysteine S-methyltransferase [Actinomycetes bacterium]MCH9801030.1 methylated-DNA--[protein]-cysteine S-methyltransferase [Actinomycetes bacterium]